MRRLLIASSMTLLLISGAAAFADSPEKCPVDGSPLQWQAAYCMYFAETDVYENDEVQECVKKEQKLHGDYKKLKCKDAIEYRHKICRMVWHYGDYKNEKACFDDKTFVPENVQKDGVD